MTYFFTKFYENNHFFAFGKSKKYYSKSTFINQNFNVFYDKTNQYVPKGHISSILNLFSNNLFEK
jgi:hypothetical protein